VDVAQIALPLRIALVALLVVAALWFTVLKPKPADTASTAPPPQAPGVAGLRGRRQHRRRLHDPGR
jgi:hypothetical protein